MSGNIEHFRERFRDNGPSGGAAIGAQQEKILQEIREYLFNQGTVDNTNNKRT
jgi:hypothetical protein